MQLKNIASQHPASTNRRLPIYSGANTIAKAEKYAIISSIRKKNFSITSQGWETSLNLSLGILPNIQSYIVIQKKLTQSYIAIQKKLTQRVTIQLIATTIQTQPTPISYTPEQLIKITNQQTQRLTNIILRHEQM